MKNHISNLFETVSSFASFAMIVLAIFGISRELLNTDGAIFQWVSRTWDANPFLLVVIGVVLVAAKQWVDRMQDARVADLLYMGAVLAGLYFGVSLLVA